MAASSALPSSSRVCIRELQQAPPIIGNALASVIGNAYDVVMESIERAIKYFGSQAALAAALGVKQPTISEWLRGDRQVPAERCPDIERATGGAVRCEELRPDVDWGVLREQATKPAAPDAPTEDPGQRLTKFAQELG
jgi:DNA-binding transcriptional regulator YdaS (Cro superfamily)